MELTGTSFLYTLAGLTITFAGFSALLLGIRQAAGGQSSSLDRYLAKTGLTQLFTLAAAALLPALLSLYGVPEMWLWRVSAVLFAVPTLSLLLTYPQRRRKAVGKGPPRIVFAIFVVLGSITIFAMLAWILAGFSHQPAVYISALFINFFTLALAFVAALDVIMEDHHYDHMPMSAFGPYRTSPRTSATSAFEGKADIA